MKSVLSVLVLVSLLGVRGARAASWDYFNLEAWPGSCQNGKRQSPIALSSNSAIITNIPPLFFENSDRAFRSTIENNGHTVQVKIAAEDEYELPTISGVFLEGHYVLDNIHFHWDSEHTIDGLRYPLEGHYVHYKEEYKNVSNAGNYPDGIVVLAVMFQESRRSNRKLSNIITAAKSVSSRLGSPRQIAYGIQLDDLLPPNTEDFFMYEGSLTTPDCNEVVTWIVFDEPLYIGRVQLKVLRHIVTDTGEILTKNYRSLQELNNRTVLHS